MSQQRISHISAAVLALAACAGSLMAGTPLEIVTATFLGTAEDDDLEGACAAPDGTIYIAGNTGTLARDLPGGIAAVTLGAATKEPKCGCGFVAQLSPDGKKILRYVQLGPGIAVLTTVAVNDKGVYASGYASEGLEELLKDRAGLTRQYTLRKDLEYHQQQLDAGKKDPIAGRPSLGRQGAPCVLRFSKDLAKLECGTYLEGWQQVYDKNRVRKFTKELEGGWVEYFWQPTGLSILASGDIIVCHDGGYFRMPKESDKALIAQWEKEQKEKEAAGEKKELAEKDKLSERLLFYDCCDHVSRLAADLDKRVWKKDIYTPAVNPEVAKKVRDGWPLPHHSSPRTLRMRPDKDENVFLCGWSASYTSKEPYWTPYLWKLDPKSGEPVWKIYSWDPMSGPDARMNGNVADTAVVTLALEDNGNILTSLLADGGNSVMGWGPRGHEGVKMTAPIKGDNFGVKLVHWWGQVQRVDGKTREGLGGARIGPWGWVNDMAPLPGGQVLAVGRCNGDFKCTPDAWCGKVAVDNPIAFVRVFAPEWDLLFSTVVPGLVPFELSRLGANRVILVGRADKEGAPMKDALYGKPLGKSDGYLLIVEAKGQ